MDVFTLIGRLTLEGADAAKSQLQGLQGFVEKNSAAFKVLGGAMTAVGAAGLVMVNASKELNAQLGQTGITLGVSTKEMRDLALATTDVTFPLESVTATFDLLARAGVRSTSEMQGAAKAFDALADATGSDAEVMAQMLIPVFRAFGLELPTTAEGMDKFTWLTKNTTIDLLISLLWCSGLPRKCRRWV